MKLKSLKLELKYWLNIMKLGTSNFLNLVVIATVNIVMNNVLKHYGAGTIYGADIPLAVSGVLAKLRAILVAVTIGIAQGCQPIFSFNIGAENYGRVKETYKSAAKIAIVISLFVFAVFQLFPRQVISIFGDGNKYYYEFGVRYIRIFMFMVCVFGIQPLSVNYFTSIGQYKQGIFLSITRQGIFLIPPLILLPIKFGMNGILASGPIADSLAFIFCIILVNRSFRRLDKMAAEKESRG